MSYTLRLIEDLERYIEREYNPESDVVKVGWHVPTMVLAMRKMQEQIESLEQEIATVRGDTHPATQARRESEV